MIRRLLTPAALGALLLGAAAHPAASGSVATIYSIVHAWPTKYSGIGL